MQDFDSEISVLHWLLLQKCEPAFPVPRTITIARNSRNDDNYLKVQHYNIQYIRLDFHLKSKQAEVFNVTADISHNQME